MEDVKVVNKQNGHSNLCFKRLVSLSFPISFSFKCFHVFKDLYFTYNITFKNLKFRTAFTGRCSGTMISTLV